MIDCAMEKIILALQAVICLVNYNLYAESTEKSSIQELIEKCNKNDFSSCASLGIRYDNGDGVKKDLKKAAGLYKRDAMVGMEYVVSYWV